jgi:hypothetical protein
MTLASILLFGIFATPAVVAAGPVIMQSAPQSTPANSPEKQDQGTAATSQNAPAEKPPAQPSAAPKKTSRAHHPRRKKNASTDCGALPAPAKEGAPASNPPSTAPAGTPAATTTQSPGTGGASKPCPPPKIVVRQGGTSEPSIQLAGGPSDQQTAQKKDGVNKLLGDTEDNLKKIAGTQLSSVQQETITQIRQFMQQSRSAVTEGDLERARTLAWKAETLSEDLVKPQR